VVCPTGEGLANRFSSADRALWLHSFVQPVELIWIDRV